MTLRVRLAITFAFVAVATAAAVAVATPVVVGRGFSQLEAAGDLPSRGQGAGPMAGMHAAQVQSDTVWTLVLVAVGAALLATVLGFVAAGILTRPLGRLAHAAGRIAGGDLAARSGLSDRGDELGELGRTFDAMAGELQAAEQTRRRLFQDVAHELKTPLAVIDATSSAVIDGVYPHHERHMATIRDQARLLSRIVDDLRTVSLAESGDLPLHRSSLSVAGLLDEVADAFRARAESARVQIATGSDAAITLHGDADRLRQALGALVDNALRVSPPGSSLELEARPAPKDAVELAVRDHGPGIAPDDLPHVFDRFYQADAARDRTSGTSGLGLAIVQAIARAHGGVAGAENAEGGGARFRLILPLA